MKFDGLIHNSAPWLAVAVMGIFGAWGSRPVCSAEPEPVNLAPAAKVTTSYVSGHETLAAVNDGFTPSHSNDRRHGVYGNWPRTGTQWVEYTWDRPISTDRIDVYWFDDRRGVRLPGACRLLFWDGTQFVPVNQPDGLGCAGDRFNTTSFKTVRTDRIRLEIDSNNGSSTGILEWRVYDSGESPAFPPIVDAGHDRVVVTGGTTYLHGSVLPITGDRQSIRSRWSLQSGPGPASIADPASPETTATFSVPGEYRLQFSAAIGSEKSESSIRVRVIDLPPDSRLEPVPTTAYRVDSRLWNGRLKALIVNWIPHCIRKISDPDLKEGGMNNFIDAANALARKPHGSHRGYVFSNAWVYNTIESICHALQVDPAGDPEVEAAQAAMRATLGEWIPTILAAQEPDGYLQTAFTLSDRQRWSPRFRGDHEGYVAGYFLDAAVVHYRLTDRSDPRLYEAAKKLADCWDRHIGPPPKQAWYDGHQAMEIGLVRFGRFVNEVEGPGNGDRYIALAKFLLDCRQDGSEYDQSHRPVIEQYEAVGHAVRAVYNYAGMADVVLETGDLDYYSAVMSLWDNLVNRKYYLTGGVGSGETSEGFGPDYSLPHHGYCESCSSCGEIFFQHKLNRIHHDAKYADLVEETLYNALLGSVDLEGKNFYYQNPLDSREPRYDWHVCPCCVGNIPRTLLMLPTWTYARSDDAIYVNQFIGGTCTVPNIAGTDVQLVQETDYPWNGTVKLRVQPKESSEFSIRIRVPTRQVSDLYTATPELDGFKSITVNGNAVTPPIDRGYAVLSRCWQAGDTIEWELPMAVQRVTGSPKIDATRGQVALQYGPLVYCMEGVDQDLDRALDPETDLTTHWQDDLLGGILVIRGVWADGSPLTAVPYFVRNHRGGRSVVWVRE